MIWDLSDSELIQRLIHRGVLPHVARTAVAYARHGDAESVELIEETLR